MKKKLILSVLVIIVMTCLFAISINATAINTDTTVTLNGSFTLGEESVTNPVVNLYDGDGYALVWYLNTDNKLVSDRAVNLISVTNNKAKFKDVSKFYGGSQQKGVVVVNLRDDFVSDGITGVEKFDSNFQFGSYNAKKVPPIQYFYFPVTATEIIDRMFQETQLIIADIEPGTPISYMGLHAVTMSNLKEFFVPNDIKEFIEKDNVGIFQDTQLEKITFEEGSQIKVIPYRCFYMCKKLKEVVLPNTVEEVHSRAFQFTWFDGTGSLEKLVLGANFKTFKSSNSEYYYVRGSNSLKEVYLPATFNADNIDANTAYQLFSYCPNAVFYYCGTEEAWDALIAKIPLKKNNETGQDTNEYILNAKANGKVVFNYSACDAFYNGNHQAGGDYNIEYSGKEWLSAATKYKACENCTAKADVKELAPLFVSLGYSTNGKGDIVQGFSFNNKDRAEYEAVLGTISYGVVAAIDNREDKTQGADVFALEKYISCDLSKAKYDFFDIKISGITEDAIDIAIFFCAYTEIGGERYFIHSGEIAQTATSISYRNASK
ncbi:MAG: hypothetical protein E7596_06940 [Ruminococcaceae bacterium]|nr:hypothetical protein [Oscillospiraceae bacterium]